jgi:antitoxin VapB
MISPKTAKLFPNGGSQAVRLPAEFRFSGVDEVFIRRDAATGEVILSAKPAGGAWTDFFALRNQALIPLDFMKGLPLHDATTSLEPREDP